MPAGQPVGDRIIWNDANEKHLLLCILAECPPSKLDWTKIAEKFSQGLSASAASQKYTKIKNRDKAIFDGGAQATTPSKKKTSGAKRASTKKGRDTPMNSASQTEEDEEDFETPTKRIKVEKGAMPSFDMGIDDEI